jgi:hypothetical protein
MHDYEIHHGCIILSFERDVVGTFPAMTNDRPSKAEFLLFHRAFFSHENNIIVTVKVFTYTVDII